MKKNLFYLVFIVCVSLNAQNVIWSDDFDDEDASEWTFLDEDGDGFIWAVIQVVDENDNPVNSPGLRSASYINTGPASGEPLEPDNWAITPAIDLSEILGNTILKWDVWGTDEDYSEENYTVYVAIGNTVADFEASAVSFNELVTDNGPGGSDNVYSKELDISSFAGETIYIAFRHHDVTDQFSMMIDNVSVEAEESASGDYCVPVLICDDGDFISNVTFQEINNDSDCSASGYTDYTDQIATVNAGMTYPISVSVGDGWYERVSLWIDFGNDGSFDEEDFLGEIGEGGTGITLEDEISIPTEVVEGEYRMRIMVYAAGEDNPASEEPCMNNPEDFGEYEDYTIKVEDNLSINNLNSSEFTYYPNPVNDILNIIAKKQVESLSVYNTVGKKLLNNLKIINGQVNLASLPSGTYIIRGILEGGKIETFKIIKK